MFLREIFGKKCIVPVVNFEKLQHVEPVIKSLSKHGFNIIEITLRNDISMQALEIASKKFPDSIIGAGTLKNAEFPAGF